MIEEEIDIFDIFYSFEDSSEFITASEARKISNETFEKWRSEYILKLKRIFKSSITKCAKNGEFSYTFDSEIMTTDKVESLVKAVEKEIIPMLHGYSVDFMILTQPENCNKARLKVCISW